MKSDVIILMSVFVILPIVAFIVVLSRAYWFYRQLSQKGMKAQGEITNYEEYANNKNQKSIFPIIKFRTSLGQEIHERAMYGFNGLHYIEKGSMVEVIYSESNPKRFMLNQHHPFMIDRSVIWGFVIGL